MCVKWVVFCFCTLARSKRNCAVEITGVNLSPTQKLRTTHSRKTNRKTDVLKNRIDAAGINAGNIASIAPFLSVVVHTFHTN